MKTILALAVVAATGAHAVGGVVPIDQNRVLAGNASPSDMPAFPITISPSGSDRPASSLMPPLRITAIDLTASDGTLAPNGFRVLAAPHEALLADVGMSMKRPRAQNLTPRNGRVRGLRTPVELAEVVPGNALPPEPVKLNDLPKPAPVTLKDLTLLRVDEQQAVLRMFVPRSSPIQGLAARRMALSLHCPSTSLGSVIDSVATDGFAQAPSAHCVVADIGSNR